MNWKYILIVIILAAVVGGGTLWLSMKEEVLLAELPGVKIKKPEKTENDKIEIPEIAIAEEKEEEFIGDLVPIRYVDKELILEKIEQGKEFLYRMENKDVHGFYKKYDALNDSFENRVHTVYSASIIYTLLKVYDFDKDERILERMPDWGDFLLSMQSKEEKTKGAFHYSYYLEEKEKEMKFVVGTAALSIFTLLDLYQRTNQLKYLESARLAGDWLTTMQGADDDGGGVMKSYQRYRDGKWYYSSKESLLYNGQVLSALSRLYQLTEEKKHYNSAEKIAKHFLERVGNDGCFLGDDYRSKNPISSAWVVMSLLDFSKINPEESYKNIIFECGKELVGRQMSQTTDPLYQGRWNMAFSTSGNGWLAEVMMEMYHFCQKENMTSCDQYKEAVVKVIRWLIQYTYSEENSSFLMNPKRAIGGLFWDYNDKYVRTDSVCHGLNAYLGIVDDLKEGVLLSLPE